MSAELVQELRDVVQKEAAQVVVRPGASTRVLFCPNPWEEVTEGRADRQATPAAQENISALTAGLLLLAANRLPEMPDDRSKSPQHAQVVERLVGGSEILSVGEMTLWQVKEAGYKLNAPADFVALEVQNQFVFRFKDGHLLQKPLQLQAAYQLGKMVGDNNTSYSYDQISKQLKTLAKGHAAAEGYRWEVVEGSHESDPGAKILMLAFGEIQKTPERQKQEVNGQRATQLSEYQRAAGIELIREGIGEPPKKLVGSVKDVLFGAPDAGGVGKGISAMAAVLAEQGIIISPKALVEAMALAYHATWNSALTTPQSVQGRFQAAI